MPRGIVRQACIDKDVGAIVTGESATVIQVLAMSADMEVRYKKNYFILLEKVYITPQTIEVGTLHPPNYKTGCLTP